MPIYAKRTDENEPEIVRQLKAVPGISVECGHDDILVGYQGKTYWVEIKTKTQLRKDGKLKAGAKRKSQKRLDDEWKGHRAYAVSVDDILQMIGIRVCA